VAAGSSSLPRNESDRRPYGKANHKGDYVEGRGQESDLHEEQPWRAAALRGRRHKSRAVARHSAQPRRPPKTMRRLFITIRRRDGMA
jgi:hypothetical protein